MNGGPGCSSLDGEMYEHGAFYPTEDGSTIYLNPNSWNTVANMLYLEAPVGVGFSYSPNQDDYKNSDNQTALDNYQALLTFFSLFPVFKTNPFFIFGESYAGIYVPTLAKAVLDGNNAGNEFINLTAFGIGNPFLDTDMNANSAIYFGYYHGMIGETLWADLNAACPDGVFYPPSNVLCAKYYAQANTAIYDSGVNYYDIDRECYHHSNEATVTLNALFQKTGVEFNIRQGHGSARADVPCIDAEGATIWLNKLEVKQALHVRTDLGNWSICSDTLRYKKELDSSLFLFDELLQHYRALIYNGDTDLACNFLGDQWAVASLDRKVTRERRPWYVNKQVAGWVDDYDKISFTTIKGVGHMVPQWAPEWALVMFTHFLNNIPLP